MTAGVHTLGPWHFDNDWHRLPSIIAPSGKIIAICEKSGHPDRASHTQQQAADARLIAASPTLLASLVEVMDAMDDGSDEPALIRARAAIASAHVSA